MDGVGTGLGMEAAEKRVLATRWQRKNGLEPGNIPFAPEAPLDTALPYTTSFMGSCPNTATI